jgi:hypothetical protein
MIQQLGRRLITASPLADENAGPRKPGSASQRPDWGFLFWNNAISFRRGLACTGISQKPRSPARVAGASCYDLAKYESIVGVMPRILRSSPRSFRGYWAFRFLRSQSVRGAPIVPVSGASLKTIDNANIFLAEPPR